MQYLNPNLEVIPIHGSLWEIKNVFTQECLDFIDGFFEHGHNWHMDRRLQRMSFPTSNELSPFLDLGQELCAVAKAAVGRDLRYRVAKLFLDIPGSEVPRHSDADDIVVMSQIYLRKSNHPIPGTMFLEPTIHTVQYEYNCGYFNLNTDKKIHQSPFLINGYRTSIGFQFI